MNLTENEIKVLESAKEEWGSFDDGFSYEIQVYNYADIDSNGAKGALSSLVQKGILIHKRIKEDGQVWNYYYGSKDFLNELNERFM